ncbi:MAG: polynucleotide adenylyltransferase PcnB [Acidobacteria bacterium]|nr:polynucleotide adenylyltransferase PcnB [Acidobacteriota bacterium]
MVEPRIIPREAHTLSRRDVDPDALKVLYRLRQGDHIAYLVGGSVRDLLLGRRPKDFDIGTSAHPSQVKKLFRNCWIIGRRFRLAHVKFGLKVIEVATFRRQVAPGEVVVQDGVPAPDPSTPEGEHLIHHDNTFGTPEEDALRRDFTINALFYDIATFSVIDYTGGLEDLRAGVVRSIGDPGVRMVEDPVRMLRAVAIAARLDFTIEPSLLQAIRTHRHEIAKSSPPRMLEEYYKILRAGSAEKTFRGLAEVGLLEPIAAELHRGANDSLWRSLAALDAYRRQFPSTPETLTNAILLGSLIVPLGISLHPPRFGSDRGRTAVRPGGQTGVGPGSDPVEKTAIPRRPPGLKLGELPLARRDVERLGQIVGLQRRIRDPGASPRAQHALAHRHIFREALTWLEIHGGPPDLVEHWKAIAAETAAAAPSSPDAQPGEVPPPGGRRTRRRRRRGRRGGGPTPH